MNKQTDIPTIYSLSSGAGIAGVAVIRISGPRAGECLKLMCRKPVEPGHTALRKIYHPITNMLLDEGLVLWFPAPGSFTGEDVVEFQIHGGRASIMAVVEIGRAHV